MNFEFATANRIIFGRGTADQLGEIARSFGERALIVTGSQPQRVAAVIDQIKSAGVRVDVFAVNGEPTIATMDDGLTVLRSANAQMVIGIGGGSVIDSAKALAALATNDGHPLDYLEVIGKGQPLTAPPLPCVAVPTTAGTGSEVTRNSVLASPEHGVKVSLRSPLMLPDVALVDPALTDTTPPAVTAASGMDALTQVIEPYTSRLANPLTDALCRQAIPLGAGALVRVYTHGDDTSARDDMALTSLFGGLALANAKLGAVHGFAGVLGGMFNAPHGAICAALLSAATATNIDAMRAREPQNPALGRYEEIAVWLTGDANAIMADGVAWLRSTAAKLSIPGLASFGITRADFDVIIEKSRQSSSMKGNPITLNDDELARILSESL